MSKLSYIARRIGACAGIFACLTYSTLTLSSLVKYYIKRKEAYERFSKMDYKTAIKDVKTPEDARLYTSFFIKPADDYKNYKSYDYFAPFEEIHKRKKDDCDGGAIAACALLYDDGYEPLFLAMYRKNKNIGHAIYVYKRDGKWGSIGINKSDWNEPKFDSVKELVASFGYDEYTLYDLDKIGHDWINGNENLKPYIIDNSKCIVEEGEIKNNRFLAWIRFFIITPLKEISPFY